MSMNEPVYDGRKETTQLGWYGGIYFRKHGPHAKGASIRGHRHHVDHITALTSGSVRVRYRKGANDEPFKVAVFIAPINFMVAAEVYHEIEALEDGTTWQCLFAIPPDGEHATIPFNDEVPEG